MKRLCSALLACSLAATVFVAGCRTSEVSTNFDPSVDFSRGFHSYAWLPEAEMGDTGVHDALTDKLMREAIETEMVAHGFAPTSGSPDFFVAYQAGVESKISSRPSSGAGVAFGSGGFSGVGFGVSTNSEVYQYDEGTLVLDFLRGDERELVWRGTVSKTVYKGQSRDERLANARKAVAEMLAEFPPKKKK